MKFPFLQAKITSQEEAWWEVIKNPGKWNVVSIWGEESIGDKGELNIPSFDNKYKSICRQVFSDIQVPTEWNGRKYTLCSDKNIKEVIEFGRAKKGDNLLIHCHAGISRSSAAMFCILLDHFKDSENPIDSTLQCLVFVKPPNLIMPNKYICGLGIYQIAPTREKGDEWIRNWHDHILYRKLYG